MKESKQERGKEKEMSVRTNEGRHGCQVWVGGGFMGGFVGRTKKVIIFE